MCVMYVGLGSKVRLITFGCVAMCSAVLFIVRSRLLVYSTGSGVNRVQVLFYPGKNFMQVWLYGISLLHSCLCV